MNVTKLNCTACGAPISVPEDLDYINCASCGSFLTIQRGEGYVALKVAEKLAKAIEDSGKGTQEVIKESTQVTRSELQRLQLAQEVSAAQMQLANIQAEIRSLQRETSNATTSAQIKNLHFLEYQAMERVRIADGQLSAPDPDNVSANIQFAENEINWINTEVQAVGASNHPQRGAIIQGLANRREVLTHNIIDRKVTELKERFRSFQLQELPLNDPIAANELLGVMTEDEKNLRALKGTPEGKLVYAELIERQHILKQALGLEQPAPAAIGRSLRSSAMTVVESGGPSMRKGCLLGLRNSVGISFVGFMLYGIFYAKKPSPEIGPGIGIFLLLSAVGLVLGARSFLRNAIPGTSIRGLFGLPNITLSQPRAGSRLCNVWMVKLLLGIITLFLVLLVTFALLGFVDKPGSQVTGPLGAVGILLAPVLAVIVAIRTTILESPQN